MKKSIKIIALVAIVAIAFTSCTKKQKCAAYNNVEIEQAK